MASIFGHGIVAYTISKVIDKKRITLLVFLAIMSSIIPDLDVIAFKLDIPYSHPLGHRGFTHSIVFALIWASVITFIAGKTEKLIYFLVLFFSTVSHGVLDAITNGGKGVGFFIPFFNERYFLPYRVIKVSPIGFEDFFSEWGIQVLMSELKYIFLPCLIILITLSIIKKSR